MEANKSTASFKRGSWGHPIKVLLADGTTKYSRKAGFATQEEAEESYRKCDVEYQKAYKAFHMKPSANIDFRDYLIFWLEHIFANRIEPSTMELAIYTLHDLILPNVTEGIRLRNVSAEYLNALLDQTSKACESAGNKSRELLSIAFKDAVRQGYLTKNPVLNTKPYKRKKAKITVLNKENTKLFLEKASEGNWYLEILFALFLGLRKGEIYGLKFSDFDYENETVSITRQMAFSPIISDGKVVGHEKLEKPPKTRNSCRTLRVPHSIMLQVQKRKMEIAEKRDRMGENFVDCGYVSCGEGGQAHSMSSFNQAVTKLCSRCGLPHLTPHSLRHMYASILLEQGVELVQISALLGHDSIHTTYEYYCEVLDENQRIKDFMNENFIPGGE